MPDAVSVAPGEVVIRLDLLDALRTANSAYVLGSQQVIVLRLIGDDYRAFTNVCTHAGCGIYLFESQRMRCQCHGSEYDVDGRNVAGPAPLPLQQYRTSLDAARQMLRISLIA